MTHPATAGPDRSPIKPFAAGVAAAALFLLAVAGRGEAAGASEALTHALSCDGTWPENKASCLSPYSTCGDVSVALCPRPDTGSCDKKTGQYPNKVSQKCRSTGIPGETACDNMGESVCYIVKSCERQVLAGQKKNKCVSMTSCRSFRAVEVGDVECFPVDVIPQPPLLEAPAKRFEHSPSQSREWFDAR